MFEGIEGDVAHALKISLVTRPATMLLSRPKTIKNFVV